MPADKETFFPILNLSIYPSEAGKEIQGLGQEPLGSKMKLWLLLEEMPDRPWLFKYARRNTGEHWAEKIASELAALIQLPSAQVELADLHGQPGALVRSVIPHVLPLGAKKPLLKGELAHGNEILAGHFAAYQKTLQWGQSEHCWDNILSALKQRLSPEEVEDSLVRLAGMLVLDAWIGNTDRHHENWAVLITPDGKKRLAPSYDHASSLGRELRDEKKGEILKSARIGIYIGKGRGGIYRQEHGEHGDNPLELVKWAASRHPEWFRRWIQKLRDLDLGSVLNIVTRVPGQEMSPISKDFTIAFLSYTLQELRRLSI